MKHFNKDNNILNFMIFKELSIYLIYNKSFKSVIELSLLSKSTFKTFQNLIISNELNKHQTFIISTITEFIKYIQHNQNNNDSYKFKLVQYKDIKEIRFSNIDEINYKLVISNILKIDHFVNFGEMVKMEKGGEIMIKKLNEKGGYNGYMGIKECEISFNNLKIIKSFLNSTCTDLKKLVVVDKVYPFFSIPCDMTFGSFYQINKLYLHFEGDLYPISIGERKDFIDFGEEWWNFEFSMDFIKRYSPIKVYFSTVSARSDITLHLNVKSLINAIDCKSIESISFENHFTNSSSIETIISSKSPIIKSLKVEIYEYDDGIEGFYQALKDSYFCSNTSLKKLLVSGYEMGTHNNIIKPKTETLDQMFYFLKLNKSLNAIGLFYFGIKNHLLLKPLIQISNITKFYTNYYGLSAALEHCKFNQNIKELYYYGTFEDPYNDDFSEDIDQDENKYTNDQDKNEINDGESSGEEDDEINSLDVHVDQIVNIFINFFKSRCETTSSLESIRIKSFDCSCAIQKRLINFGKGCKNFPSITIK